VGLHPVSHRVRRRPSPRRARRSTKTETVYVSAASSGAQPEVAEPGGTASADGKQLFTSIGCGSCHTLAAAGATGKEHRRIEDMIVHPNSEVEGYAPNVMPQTYGHRS
jgi:mono/diheme cytochrome c family protein